MGIKGELAVKIDIKPNELPGADTGMRKSILRKAMALNLVPAGLDENKLSQEQCDDILARISEMVDASGKPLFGGHH